MTSIELMRVVIASINMLATPQDDYGWVDREEIFCLAQTVYHEARGASTELQTAVAYVALDRMTHEGWPDTVCGVIRQRHQFSPNIRRKKPITDHTAWVNSVDVALLAYTGVIDRNTISRENPTWFHADTVAPLWARKLKHVGTVDDHLFYR